VGYSFEDSSDLDSQESQSASSQETVSTTAAADEEPEPQRQTNPNDGSRARLNKSEASDPSETINPDDIPLKLRRDSVRDDRPSHITVAIQTETEQRINEAKQVLEREFENDNVPKLDVYELLILAGTDNIDSVIERALEMGYGLTE